MSHSAKKITLNKVRVHNLKEISLELEPNQLIVFTGVSGSGKSSLAFDTIYVEGQRRYIESLSTAARRHFSDLPKPDAESIDGISPTIAIEQKTTGKNPRSTVGTITGIYDFLRVLYARVGTAHCPVSGEEVKNQSLKEIVDTISGIPEKTKIIVLAPYIQGKKAEFKDEFALLLRKGFTRVRLDGEIVEIGEEIAIDGSVAHDLDIVIDRLLMKDEPRLKEAIGVALEIGKGLVSILNLDTKEETLYSQFAYSPKSGLSYPALEPHDFSFNHPRGMCPTCQGLGRTQEYDLKKIIDPEKSIAEDCCLIASSYNTVRFGNIYNNLARLYKFKVTTPWKKLSEEAKRVFLYGTEKKWTRMRFVHPVKKNKWNDYVQWRGVLYEAHKRYRDATSDHYRQAMEKLMSMAVCPTCEGEKIRAYPAATKLCGKRITEITSMPIGAAHTFLHNLKLKGEKKIIAEELLRELIRRYEFLIDVGLHYLTLDRTAPTLSGGESQRVRLASQIGAGLVGATYILDEPSIGLHPRDNDKLLLTLKKLRDKGNTLIVVEHDEDTILTADHVVDIGPEAGEKGGEIIVQGSPEKLIATPKSLTGRYLSGKLKVACPPKKRKPGKKRLQVLGATHHNLKKVDLSLPLGLFVCVTGVSGSGKSSLISDILHPALSNVLHKGQRDVGAHKAIKGVEHIDKVIAIDQSAIGRTPRSNPATYIKLFDLIRDLFSQLPQSSAKGFTPGRFSFNVKEGSCTTCGGMGMLKIDMDFLEDEWVICQECKGKRFDDETLSILYKGKNIHDVLSMTVSEALAFFSAHPPIVRKLSILEKVGLEYLTLGQASPTLSGGEAQRIKLSRELSKTDKGHTLYILDEPTTGLHFHDVNKLLGVLQPLVDKKNTVLVIEHNIELIKAADWIIDLGPEAGDEGGEIIAEGPPEKLGKGKTATGLALQKKTTPTGKEKRTKPLQYITAKNVEQNNLKGITTSFPRGQITVCTGPSGSGKSSFAFETIYAEGQRRYTDSLSPYARQFVKQMPKPKFEYIEGLSAAIAIEQKVHAGNPRSTIGTMTESYDYLRILYAYLGTAHCPETGEEIKAISINYVLNRLLDLPEKTKLIVLAPISIRKGEQFSDLCDRLQRLGFLRIRLNSEYFELEEEIPFLSTRKNQIELVIDRLAVKKGIEQRLLEALSSAAQQGEGQLLVDTGEKDLFFNLSFAVESTGKSYPPITPHTFSFNTEHGMCVDCQGLGFQYGANFAHTIQNMMRSPVDLIDTLWKENGSDESFDLFYEFLEKEKIDPFKPLRTLLPKQLNLLLNGSDKFINNTFRWVGINTALAKLAKTTTGALKQQLLPLLDQHTCPSCNGTRLNPLARNVTINNLSIADFCNLSIEEAHRTLETFPKGKDSFLEEAFAQLSNRLNFLNEIGLHYLSLSRSAPTLSGGETQRIRLSRQLGSGLTGCLYVLDEPTIGLHPHNTDQLNRALQSLCDMGNTLLLIEHDPLTLQIANHVIDFGPEAGERGGNICAEGTLSDITNNPNSPTGQYLSGRKKIPLPEKTRVGTSDIIIKDATLNNLKNLTVEIPKACFTCITGVSGSGKSTLINDLLRPAVQTHLATRSKSDEITYLDTTISGIKEFSKLIFIDQNPIGHTARADVTTYTDLLTHLRSLFASLPLAKAKGLQPKHFSYNHRRGMCTSCWGLGTKKIEMQYLPPLKITCDICRGYRLNPISLEVTYKEKHLGQILAMTVADARPFLDPFPKITRILDTLISVGLDYLTLDRELSSLSGGEAGRIRLSRELAKPSRGKTLYLLDEPTIGLHSDDIAKLLPIFQHLVGQGHTLVIIEHNLDIIASADHIIDLGPEAGSRGGEIIAIGTPKQIAYHPISLTGKHLQKSSF